MNNVHLHLMLVHIPVITVPLGTILLAISVWKKNNSIKLVALNLFVIATLFTIAAFKFGEKSEEKVEHIAGVSESRIEDHEESAESALWLTISLGALSLLTVIGTRYNTKLENKIIPVVLILGIIASASLAYTAQEGGKIRHPEAFGKLEKKAPKLKLESSKDN